MRNKLGQIALPLILLISGVIVEIVIAGSLVTYFSSSFGYGSRLNSRAYAAAYSGLNDALIKISRDKDFGVTNPSYELSLNNDKVNIYFQSSVSGDYYVYDIVSLGKSGTKEVKLHALVSVSRQNGLVSLQLIEELPAKE